MTTTAITRAPQPFEPSNMNEAQQLAQTLSVSALLPDALRGKPADVLVTILTGHELGLSPMQAIRGLYIVKGRAVMSADLAVALVKRHTDCVYFKLVNSTDSVATYETERRGEGVTKMSFTAEQARTAQLGGDNWKKYPAAMLRARCSLALARAVYPDIMLGVYDPDEIAAPVGSVTPITSAPPLPEKTVAQRPETKPAPTQAAARAQPEDAELVEPGSDVEEAPPAPTPVEQAVDAIAGAGTLAELGSLTEFIVSLAVAKNRVVRDAYNHRKAQLSGAAR